jgi:hypothetical protein
MGFDFILEQFPEENVRLRFIRDYVRACNGASHQFSDELIADGEFLRGFDVSRTMLFVFLYA